MAEAARRDYTRCPKCDSGAWTLVDAYGKRADELHFLCYDCGYEEIMIVKQKGEKLTRDQKRRGLIPIPDPLGLFTGISQGFFFDPLLNARELEHENGGAKVEAPVPNRDDRIDAYVNALKRAYDLAPCSGCKKLVRSALVGAKVYQKMLGSGLSADEVKGEALEQIQKDVEKELNDGS